MNDFIVGILLIFAQLAISFLTGWLGKRFKMKASDISENQKYNVEFHVSLVLGILSIVAGTSVYMVTMLTDKYNVVYMFLICTALLGIGGFFLGRMSGIFKKILFKQSD
jgi:MFS family permease